MAAADEKGSRQERVAATTAQQEVVFMVKGVRSALALQLVDDMSRSR